MIIIFHHAKFSDDRGHVVVISCEFLLLELSVTIPTIIASLVVSGICWLFFVVWIIWLESGKTRLAIAPIFPPSVAMRRPTGPVIL